MPQTVTYATGTQNLSTAQLPNDVIIRLAGTVPYPDPSTPTLVANPNLAPPFTPVTVGKIEVLGTDATPNYGSVETAETFFTIQHGIKIQDGTLWMDSNLGYTLDGKSVIADGGTLDALGGRYLGSSYTLNGSLSVGDNSTANFSESHLTGNGTVKTTAPSATIDVKQTGGPVGNATDTVHFDLTKGGTLNIFENFAMSFVADIRMGDDATVNLNSVLFSTPATSEVWHSQSDVLDLFNAAGQNVAELDFAKGTPELYVAPTANTMPAPMNYTANSVAITTHWAAGDLPVTVVHS